MSGEDEETKEQGDEIEEVPPDTEGMLEVIKEPPEGVKVPPGLPGLPVFMGEEEPTGQENKSKYWILKEPSSTDEEIAEAKNINVNTVRIARSHLVRDGFIRKERKLPGGKQKALPSTALTPQGISKGIQIFAKGSPPEAIIESISIPMVDGQAEGFQKGMKFGMSTLVLAVRVMQELSAVSLQQVQPLIALTKAVREGEQAAFKGGAEEGAMKAARAMGDTILPMMSEIQAGIASAARSGEADPFRGMMVRAMEPMIKNLIAKMVPGVQQDQTPQGWERKSE